MRGGTSPSTSFLEATDSFRSSSSKNASASSAASASPNIVASSFFSSASFLFPAIFANSTASAAVHMDVAITTAPPSAAITAASPSTGGIAVSSVTGSSPQCGVVDNSATTNLMMNLVARRKNACPLFIRVNEWNGRLGNHYHQMGQAIVAAELCGIKSVRFPAHISKNAYQRQDGLLDAPSEILLPGPDLHAGLTIPSQCPEGMQHNWYHNPCVNITAREYKRVMMEYVRPVLGADLSACMSNSTPIEEDLLTIHLRNDDIMQYVYMFWGQPPCSMYEKIILEEKFKKILVVGAGQGPCQQRLRSFAKGQQLQLREQGLKIYEDFCALARARHLVLSFSSFSISAALLSKEVRTIYRRKDSDWEGRLRAIINCDVWPGVRMLEYGVRVQVGVGAKKDEGGAKLAREFLTTFPMEQIQGPFLFCAK
ncbi:unnamed protein product [Polarella glacialis]|uniref:O-fucosyltransferase family protein n=1 Tax=Polarella glacialis TaxID=89957 RepID=A0A813KKY5_POLGL|nr:unnamed protein product [Polarella glacialis]